MLYTSTVEPRTLAILKGLFELEFLNGFYLVGGTNLSLRYGHRISVDLDLFSTKEFLNEDLIVAIEEKFPQFTYRGNTNKIGVFGFIDDVKIDFVRHHYFKQIDTPILIDGIKLFGDKDIMAMKVFAILKRGAKKDFWDVAELLEKYTISDFVSAFEKKYPSNTIPISVPYALTYFEDADESEDPISLKGQTWESVQAIIQKAVRDYLA